MLQAMWAIDSEEATQSLQNGGIVTISTIDITTLEILIGDKVRKRIVLPMPIDSTIGKTKVARKSLWIEYTAPIANAKLLASRADAIFPFCSTSR